MALRTLRTLLGLRARLCRFYKGDSRLKELNELYEFKPQISLMTLMASTDFKDLLGLRIKRIIRIIKPQISRMSLML